MEKIKVIKFVPKEIEIEVKELTDIQREYIKAVEDYKRENFAYPSIRTLVNILGRSTPSSVYLTLNRLEDKGYYYREMEYKDYDCK